MNEINCKASIRLCIKVARACATSWVDEVDDEEVADVEPVVVEALAEFEEELLPTPICDKA